MTTEIATSHQTPSDHEPIEKVTEEVKPVEPEIVSVAKKTEEEEEDLKPDELASQSAPLAKSEKEVEDNEAEPPTVEVKMIDDAPIVDDEMEVVKDPIPDPHTSSVLAPVSSVVNGKSVVPAIEFVPKEAEEQPSSSSLEELPREEPNAVVPVSLEEAVEKPREPPEVLVIKESEPIVAKDTEDSGVSNEVDKPKLVIPEDEVKLKEQSEAGKQVEKPKTVEVIEKPEEPLEVLPIKSEALVVKDAEDS
ncbi:hypothetical protein SADUNF_Sadunf05G0001500 [Salix dunnii]|uniref:Uncharacterized protein n=1 Tax=Salix dunnii TaxID=1413687 RepID=A0A835K3N6_9ROSI|nr:hypothetical protein SADUNF_Sadunf05G0001500 [Salix dunnii]